MSAALSTGEQLDLTACETVVREGLATFVEVGRALAEIRDRRLYRTTHSTFAEYADERWLLSRTRAYRFIDAAKVDAALSPIGDTPANEAQARELAPLKDDEQAMIGVWRELREQHGDRLTAHRVKVEVGKVLARRPKVDCPGCGRMVLVDRIDPFPPRPYKPGRCDRCGNKMPVEIAIITPYSIDSERKRQLAEKAAARLWTVVSHRGGNPIGDEPIAEVIHLDRALAVLSDEHVAGAITSLEKGIAETKAMVAELRRHQSRNGGSA